MAQHRVEGDGHCRQAEYLKEGNEYEEHHQIEHYLADPAFNVDVRGGVAAYDQFEQSVIYLRFEQNSTDAPGHQMSHYPSEYEDSKREDDMCKGGEVLLPPVPPFKRV